MWSFSISFIHRESEGERVAGKRFKDHPIESFCSVPLSEIEQRVKGYKPGIKPLKHQKKQTRDNCAKTLSGFYFNSTILPCSSWYLKCSRKPKLYG